MAWLLAEDKALKERLAGITVTDPKNAARPVEVWFRFPQKEIRSADFPFITIDLVDIQFDRVRAHAGYINPAGSYEVPNYTPDGRTDTVASTYFPTPVNLYYQVVTYTRNALHDRELHGKLLAPNYLPMRFGWLDVADYSIRRLELRSVTPADVRDRDGNTTFRKVYTVEVSSEMLAGRVFEVLQATRIHTTLHAHTPPPNPNYDLIYPGWTAPDEEALSDQPTYITETITTP